MAITGRLTKIKSALKKWQSFGKLGRSNSSIAASSTSFSDEDFSSDQMSSQDNFPVYVGKSRREYLVSSEILEHPVFCELVEKSGDEDGNIVVSCEVVLFEHLLWMLKNADPQPESLDELVEFYEY